MCSRMKESGVSGRRRRRTLLIPRKPKKQQTFSNKNPLDRCLSIEIGPPGPTANCGAKGRWLGKRGTLYPRRSELSSSSSHRAKKKSFAEKMKSSYSPRRGKEFSCTSLGVEKKLNELKRTLRHLA